MTAGLVAQSEVVRLLREHDGAQRTVAAALGLNPVTVGRIAKAEGYMYPKAQSSARARSGRVLRQSERQFQAQVVDLATRLGWRPYHTWISIHSAAGFPDLVLVRAPRVIFAELKRDGASPTAAQEAWIAELRQCPGVEVHVWRPADFEAIVACLRGGTVVAGITSESEG